MGGIREEEIGGNREIGRNGGVGKGSVKKERKGGREAEKKKREESWEGDKVKEGKKRNALEQ